MDEKCSFRDSVFLKDVPDKLLKCVRIAYPWDEKKFTPKFNGIPPRVTLMAEMEGLRLKFYALIVYIKGNMDDMIDKRGVDG